MIKVLFFCCFFFKYLVSGLQLLVLQLKVKPEPQEGTSLKDLIRDPYILIAAGKYFDLMLSYQNEISYIEKISSKH